MNEVTISGNVTADPVLRYGRDSDTTAFLAFTFLTAAGTETSPAFTLSKSFGSSFLIRSASET